MEWILRLEAHGETFISTYKHTPVPFSTNPRIALYSSFHPHPFSFFFQNNFVESFPHQEIVGLLYRRYATLNYLLSLYRVKNRRRRDKEYGGIEDNIGEKGG